MVSTRCCSGNNVSNFLSLCRELSVPVQTPLDSFISKSVSSSLFSTLLRVSRLLLRNSKVSTETEISFPLAKMDSHQRTMLFWSRVQNGCWIVCRASLIEKEDLTPPGTWKQQRELNFRMSWALADFADKTQERTVIQINDDKESHR